MLSLTSTSSFLFTKPRYKDRCCSAPEDQQTHAVPEDNKAFGKQAFGINTYVVAFGVNFVWVSCGLSSELLCCSNITPGRRNSLDRDVVQPTKLKHKTRMCLHHSRSSAQGTSISFKEFNHTFPDLIHFPCYHAVNIPFP